MKIERIHVYWGHCVIALVMVLALAFVLPARALAQDEIPEQPTETPALSEESEGDPLTPAPGGTMEVNAQTPIQTETEAPDTETSVVEATADATAMDPMLTPDEVDPLDGTPMEETVALVNPPEALTGGDPSGTLGDPTGLVCDNGSPSAGMSFSFYLAAGSGHGNGYCHINGTTVQAWWDAPIQEAIDHAQAGTTITITGEFTEAFHIYKALTIQGVGDPIIHSPSDIPDANMFVADTTAYYPIILVSNTDEVTIQGLHIAGDSQGLNNERFAGILFGNASGSILNNYIEGVNDGATDELPTGVGILVYNDGAQPESVTISGNTMEDFKKVAIAVQGSNLTVNTSKNNITGTPNDWYISQQGILYSNGARGVISDNTIQNVIFLGWYDSSVAIAATGIPEGTLTISGNTLTNDQIGIYLEYVSDSIVTGNTITGGYAAFSFNNIETPGVNATFINNTVTDSTYGVYTGAGWLVVNYNNFYNTPVGLCYMNVGVAPMDATMNYWGCSTGPNTPGCGELYGEAMYIPFLIAPVGSPLNRDLSSLFNQFTVPPGPEPVIVIPEELAVASGQMVDLSCSDVNRLTLPDGTNTLFTSILCGYSASMTSTANSLTIAILQDGTPLDVLPGDASFVLSFAIPQGMQAPYTILYWDPTLNGGAGNWMVLPDHPGLLHEGDARTVLQGVTQVGNFVRVQVNFTGTFVLVSQ
jgi:parallel beta-helix repeat protein